MLDHIGLAVIVIARSRAFYEAALAPLGISTHRTEMNGVGGTAVLMGDDDVCFVIADRERPGQGNHIAFRAGSREQVDAFHAAAVAAGGRDNGAPGLRTVYAPDYYAAFVLDPDGFNVEAVCHLDTG